MAEEKVIEHVKKAVRAASDKESSWQKKLKEFLLEVAIIVFAVSITLWFHNLNDHSHEKKMAKAFLVATKADLKKSISDLGNTITNFHSTEQYYDSLWKQVTHHRVDSAYADLNSGFLLNTNYLIFDYSLFENFKSSGNLRLIENQALLKKITHLYSTSMPFYQAIDKTTFDGRREDYAQYIGRRAVIDSNGTPHISKLLNEPAVQYQLIRDMKLFEERTRHMKSMQQEMSVVAEQIDKELEEAF